MEKIQSTFAGLYSLELVTITILLLLILLVCNCCLYLLLHCGQGEEGDKIIEKALKEPEKFVAKPQREGGGKQVMLYVTGM